VDLLSATILEEPQGDEIDAALRSQIERFFGIGGTITLQCWLSLDERSRCAIEDVLYSYGAQAEVSAAVDSMIERMRGWQR